MMRNDSHADYWRAAATIAAGCAATEPTLPDYSEEQALRDEIWSLKPTQPVVEETPDVPEILDEQPEPLFSFVARNLPIGQACRLFGQTYNLNIVVDQDVDRYGQCPISATCLSTTSWSRCSAPKAITGDGAATSSTSSPGKTRQFEIGLHPPYSQRLQQLAGAGQLEFRCGRRRCGRCRRRWWRR